MASSPRVRTANSRSLPSTRPPGISAFSRRMAASTSWVVSPRAAMRNGSSQTRMAYRRSPPMITEPTPLRRWIRSLRIRSATSESSSPSWRSLERASQTMAWASASTLAITGSSTSRGSSPRIRETRSRTSLAASSTSWFSSNSMVITEPCSRLDEERVLTPERVANCSSRILVISVSTTLGLAPR